MKKEAMLYERLEGRKVSCQLCSHRCQIKPGQFGICGVRQNIEGTLYTLVYAEPIAVHTDPIEKKPLYHFFPGSSAYSIATVGCNFKCDFCQNWQISQASKREGRFASFELLPEEVVRDAKRNKCLSISYTYTEPTIFFEYAYDTAKLAKEAGLYNNFVTNGFMTPQALDTIGPYLDAANVDLKSFREEFYTKNCKAHLKPVLDSIAYMKKLGVWVEVTTLVIPDENDSEQELSRIAEFIASVGRDIPWHISRFHPDYKFTDHPPTSIEILRRAAQIGKEKGLRYIYLGNVVEGNDTYCYRCGKLLIKRTYFYVERLDVKQGRCIHCGAQIDGLWSK
jgi:pyruvate formate lyase activating enzyme